MSTHEVVFGTAVSIRRVAWRAGSMILLAMGGASVAFAIGGLILAGGGVSRHRPDDAPGLRPV